MPEILPDLSEVSSNLIDPGAHPALINTVTPGKAKSSGNAKLDVETTVYFNDKEFKRTVSVPIAGAGAFRYLQLLRAAGFGDHADKLKRGERAPVQTEDLEGQKITVIIEHEEWQGEPRDKITKFVKTS